MGKNLFAKKHNYNRSKNLMLLFFQIKSVEGCNFTYIHLQMTDMKSNNNNKVLFNLK